MALALSKPKRATKKIDYLTYELAKRPRVVSAEREEPALAVAPPPAAATAVANWSPALPLRRAGLDEHYDARGQRRRERAPQACAFGPHNGSGTGFHDNEGNFYRVGDIVWIVVDVCRRREGEQGQVTARASLV